MSMYRGFMAATQTANTINTRRTALAVDALVQHQFTATAEAEARREREGALKQVVFDGAKIVQEAKVLLPQSPAAALYLSLRARSIIGPGGVTDTDLPDLQDKAFCHQTASAARDVESHARAGLQGQFAGQVERITALEAAIPLLQQYAALAEIEALVNGRTTTLNGNERGLRGTINMVGGALIGGMLLTAVLDIFSSVAGGVCVLVFLGLAVLAFLQGMNRPRLVRRATAILAGIGEAFPVGLTDTQVRQRATELRARVESLPVVTSLGQSPLSHDAAREDASRFQTEHDSLWRQTFAHLDTAGPLSSFTPQLPA
jgi:hypothetical protein